MKISVLMPVYSTPVGWCRRAVESIRAQRKRPGDEITLVIVDDNNPPGELRDYIYEQATCECKTDIIRTNENRGIAAALNVGIKACQGDIIIRMDADDIANEKLISKHADFFDQFPARHICGVQIKLFSDGRVWHSHHPRVITREFALETSGFWFVNHPGIAYRRETVMELGGYGDVPAHLAEDYALWIKFLRAGYTIYNRDEILVDYRVHQKTFSTAPNRRSSEWFEFLKIQKESL